MRFLMRCMTTIYFFFFQAEDGIRDWSVTGVQTCALPICRVLRGPHSYAGGPWDEGGGGSPAGPAPGRAPAQGDRGGRAADRLQGHYRRVHRKPEDGQEILLRFVGLRPRRLP